MVRIFVPLIYPLVKCWCNYIRSFVSLSLPVGVHSSAKDRLSYCNQQSQVAKKSLNAFMQLWFQNNVMAYLPAFMTQKIAFDVFSRHSLILSNVPGPARVVMYGEHKLLGMQFFFPNLLPQYDVVSYNGSIFACISLPIDVVRSPDLLPDLFLEEVKELAKTFGVSMEEDYMFSPMSDGGVFGLASRS
jgi:hypothetical protein